MSTYIAYENNTYYVKKKCKTCYGKDQEQRKINNNKSASKMEMGVFLAHTCDKINKQPKNRRTCARCDS